ncbi:hypothetical protein F3Y22_tig00111582pilonHSYRG00356 [Hibiscus syriacus]|uniref:Retrotransposon gag domain-containing protein n=1 Tax=Hibiscus syriacus TaxID=106335 RepID=A0A6A2XLJ1_HIBSY|nr:hypothetical protein F3Y22_tig00111582pilonHSYRG00356 [Hibiscus syriacus]
MMISRGRGQWNTQRWLGDSAAAHAPVGQRDDVHARQWKLEGQATAGPHRLVWRIIGGGFATYGGAMGDIGRFDSNQLTPRLRSPKMPRGTTVNDLQNSPSSILSMDMKMKQCMKGCPKIITRFLPAVTSARSERLLPRVVFTSAWDNGSLLELTPYGHRDVIHLRMEIMRCVPSKLNSIPKACDGPELRVFKMEKGFHDQAGYNTAEKYHSKKASRIVEGCAHKDHMADKEQNEIRKIKEQMSRMMDRITALAKEKETSVKEKIELDKNSHAMSNTQGTVDPNQSEKSHTIIIWEVKLENPVRTKSRGGSHFDSILISYKELYDALLEAREVALHYVKLLQPPYPSWHDINVRCENHVGAQGHSIDNCTTFKYRVHHILDYEVLEFKMKGRLGLVTDCPVKVEPKVFKEKRYDTTVNDLKRYQAKNQMLNLSIANMEASYQCYKHDVDVELEATRSRNKKLMRMVLVPQAAGKEKVEDKGNQCHNNNASKVIICPGASNSSPKMSLVDYEQFEDEFKRLNEAIKDMKVFNASHKELEARELSLVPDLVIPHEFRVPNFEIYDGTSCPLIHLKMFCRRMEGHLNDDDLLIHFFHNSLVGPAVVWYNHLNREQIKTWVNRADDFLGQYRYVKGLASKCHDLQRIRMKANERFK